MLLYSVELHRLGKTPYYEKREKMSSQDLPYIGMPSLAPHPIGFLKLITLRISAGALGSAFSALGAVSTSLALLFSDASPHGVSPPIRT